MRTILKCRPSILALIVTLASACPVWASSATFAIRGQGIAPGQAEEVHENGKPLPPRFHAKVEVGQSFTLTAQGLILPRGGKEEPGEPDCGVWLFDDAMFKRLPHDKKQADKTMVVIRLQPTTVGRTRIRFLGQILGYERTFDVMVEVVAPKP